MRSILRVTIAALSVASITPAFAGDGEGPIANTQFTLNASPVAQVPVASASPTVVAQDRDLASSYATRANHVVSLFLPLESGGGDN
jgi:hypothetical protein